MKEVSVYTGLIIHAFQNDQEALYRLYAPLRQWNKEQGGNGWIKTSAVFSFAHEYLGLTRSYTSQLLRKGDGVWWRMRSNSVSLVSPRHIVEDAQLEVRLPVEVFREMQDAKAHWFAAFFAFGSWFIHDDETDFIVPQGFKTISRKKLTEIFGISKTTQIRYEKRSGLAKRYSFIVYKVTEHTAEKLPIRDDGVYRQRGQYWLDVDNDGTVELVSQTANGYQSALSARQAPRRYQNKSLSGEVRQKCERFFYDQPQKAYKAVTRERRDACLLTNKHLFGSRKTRVFEGLMW